MARNRSIMEMYNDGQSPERPLVALWLPLLVIMKLMKYSIALK